MSPVSPSFAGSNPFCAKLLSIAALSQELTLQPSVITLNVMLSSQEIRQHRTKTARSVGQPLRHFVPPPPAGGDMALHGVATHIPKKVSEK
jgi:hypothetical protein